MGVELLLLFPPVKKIIDLVRYAFEGDVIQWKEIGLTVGAWVAAMGAIFLASVSSFAGDLGLVDVLWADIVLMGVTVGASASVVVDVSTPGGIHVE